MLRCAIIAPSNGGNVAPAKKPNEMTAKITRTGQGYKEVVDTTPYNTIEERAEAMRLLNEYRIADPSAIYRLTY